MKKRERLVAELHAAGVTTNGHGLIDKQPIPVLEGMVQKVREDQAARAAGAGPCSEHEGQVEGACPYCRGIWC